jgi:hypothetical protein
VVSFLCLVCAQAYGYDGPILRSAQKGTIVITAVLAGILVYYLFPKTWLGFEDTDHIIERYYTFGLCKRGVEKLEDTAAENARLIRYRSHNASHSPKSQNHETSKVLNKCCEDDNQQISLMSNLELFPQLGRTPVSMPPRLLASAFRLWQLC